MLLDAENALDVLPDSGWSSNFLNFANFLETENQPQPNKHENVQNRGRFAYKSQEISQSAKIAVDNQILAVGIVCRLFETSH